MSTPTFPCTRATHALSQTPTSQEPIPVMTVHWTPGVVVELKVHLHNMGPDSTLLAVESGCSHSKVRFKYGCSHETVFLQILQTAAPIQLAGALFCSNWILLVNAKFPVTLSTRLLYALPFLRPPLLLLPSVFFPDVCRFSTLISAVAVQVASSGQPGQAARRRQVNRHATLMLPQTRRRTQKPAL